MRTLAARPIAGLLALLVGCGVMAGTPRDVPVSNETRRLLAEIAATRNQRTPADFAAARRLEAEGDRAYRRGDYRAAFDAYANAYPNAPNAHAYVLAADAKWRAAITAVPRPSSVCRVEHSHFAHDIEADLDQHYGVGIALAAQERGPHAVSPALVARAREASTCLRALALTVDAQPAGSCVDVERLKACLGEPLLR